MVLMPHILVNPGTKPSLPYKRGNPTLEPATASVERGSAGGGPRLKRTAGHVLPWTWQLAGGGGVLADQPGEIRQVRGPCSARISIYSTRCKNIKEHHDNSAETTQMLVRPHDAGWNWSRLDSEAKTAPQRVRNCLHVILSLKEYRRRARMCSRSVSPSWTACGQSDSADIGKGVALDLAGDVVLIELGEGLELLGKLGLQHFVVLRPQGMLALLHDLAHDRSQLLV